MIENILKVLLTPQFYVVMGIIVIPVVVVASWSLWLQYTSHYKMMLGAIEYGLWSSNHQTVNTGEREDYFDSDLFLGQPSNLGPVVSWVKEELENQREVGEKINRLVFIETEKGPVGAVTLKDLLSWETKLPSVIVRLGRKGPALKITHVEQGRVSADLFKTLNGRSERMALVSDVATTGTTLVDAARIIELHGGRIDMALVLYDREEGKGAQDCVTAESKLKNLDIRLVAMIKADGLRMAVREKKNLREAAKRKGVVGVDALSGISSSVGW